MTLNINPQTLQSDEKTSRLKRLISFFANITRKEPQEGLALRPREQGHIRKLMNESVQNKGGSVAARASTATIAQTYLELGNEGRLQLIEILNEFSLNPLLIDNALDQYTIATDKDLARVVLQQKLESPRKKLLQGFNFSEQGIECLIEVRQDLLNWLPNHPELKALESELSNLLNLWLDVGFLELGELSWDSPASLLQQLITYEAVHPINSWDDLHNRMDTDRTCFAFFHPRLPETPLIFVEVAFWKGLAGSVQEILDTSKPRTTPKEQDTAIFYSISNTQEGLRGISFGNFLIKKAVEFIQQEYPHIGQFSTLSPIPGFRSWLIRLLKEDNLEILMHRYHTQAKPDQVQDIAEKIRELVSSPEEIMTCDSDVKSWMEGLCSIYLTEPFAKGNKWTLDPVAKFHLTNGARVERINWLGDTSARGLKQSFGMMANYYYDLAKVEQYHDGFEANKIAVSYKPKGLITNLQNLHT